MWRCWCGVNFPISWYTCTPVPETHARIAQAQQMQQQMQQLYSSTRLQFVNYFKNYCLIIEY